MKRPFDSDSVCAVVYFFVDCILVWRVNSAGPDTVLKTVGTLVVWESSSPPSATIQFDSYGVLAQLVEHLLCKQDVRSSSLLHSKMPDPKYRDG